MSNEVVEVSNPLKPLSKDQMLAAVRTVQEVMKTVMKDGEHYGVIPGCGNKPTLLKAGSEKLLHTFGFGTEVEVDDMFPGDTDRVGYRVTVTVRNRDGRLMGTGVGEASSEEKKWKWRESVCEEEWNEKLDDERQRKWQKDKQGNPYCIHQIRNNPYDLSNTILKMAKKRAQIDATLTVCACSDIFSQDLEELVDNDQAPKRASSRPAQQAQPSGPIVPKTSFFKEFGGKPWSEVPRDQLEWYADALHQNIEDPAKSRYKAQNEGTLKQIIAEIDERNRINRELDAQAAEEA